ncbi:uncharacterized protein SCODWIG_00332 [Saccharomycodes ludwigii]|uniref:AB hydrolase-1 domain-containing protein n=2 Tax=Saccharomycodes ludwigii TaxID=36035 RepID=A0A376B1P4_9ASCO|nr:uncharacterized protein SCODWIG_00332 [Saccharomycodes ludwigii]
MFNKHLSRNLNTDVYSIDLRNHGDSPRALPYDNLTLSKDVSEFILKQIVPNYGPNRKVSLVGYSLGGRIAMLTCLHRKVTPYLHKLISVDIPPKAMPALTDEIVVNYLAIMEILNAGQQYLQHKVTESVEHHKIPHLILKDSKNQWKSKVLNHFKKINSRNPSMSYYFSNGFTSYSANNDLSLGYPILYDIPLLNMPDYLSEIVKWPNLYVPPYNHDYIIHQKCQIPTLFIKALKSPFIPREHYQSLGAEFKNYRVVEINTTHNVIGERPKEFVKIVTDFLSA